MAQAPIQYPTPNMTGAPWLDQRAGIVEASSGAFTNAQFVRAQGSGSAQTLIKVTDAASAGPVYGLSNRDALGANAEPYKTPTATTHNPTDTTAVKFWVNTMTGTRAVGTGSATALVAGSTYDIRTFTTANYTNVQGLDASSTAAATAGFFKYTGQIHPDDVAADTNCRVLVSVVAPYQG